MHLQDEEKINTLFFQIDCRSYTSRPYDVIYVDNYSSNATHNIQSVLIHHNKHGEGHIEYYITNNYDCDCVQFNEVSRVKFM